jgi:hypothetical protein
MRASVYSERQPQHEHLGRLGKAGLHRHRGVEQHEIALVEHAGAPGGNVGAAPDMLELQVEHAGIVILAADDLGRRRAGGEDFEILEPAILHARLEILPAKRGDPHRRDHARGQLVPERKPVARCHTIGAELFEQRHQNLSCRPARAGPFGRIVGQAGRRSSAVESRHWRCMLYNCPSMEGDDGRGQSS